jgi:pimeloyl-ACP methyl ester carboxylesterase
MLPSEQYPKPLTGTILLFHGWNYIFYTSLVKDRQVNPWSKSGVFLSSLNALELRVITVSFPGFAGYSEPEPSEPWTMDDYVAYCDRMVKRYSPSIILGRSFGGAVVACWKSAHPESRIPVMLLAPALLRDYSKSSVHRLSVAKRLIPQPLLSIMRDLYLTRIVCNPFYIHGSPFLRESYVNIVKLRSAESLLDIPPSEYLLLFGSEDADTPPHLLQRYFDSNESIRERIVVVPGAGHNLQETHPDEVVGLLNRLA